jgi:translation initiation factor 1A
MPNVKGGRNYKKSKKGGHQPASNGEMPLADTADKMYASVKKRLGGKRIEVVCTDNKERQAKIPGTFYKRVWFNAGDIILVQVDPLDPSEVFILYKYQPNESSQLKAKGLIGFEIGAEEDELGIVFGESEDEEDEDVYEQVDKAKKELSASKEKELREKNALAKSLERKGARATKTVSGIDENGEVDIDKI